MCNNFEVKTESDMGGGCMNHRHVCIQAVNHKFLTSKGR
jgi:hypothetical protein